MDYRDKSLIINQRGRPPELVGLPFRGVDYALWSSAALLIVSQRQGPLAKMLAAAFAAAKDSTLTCREPIKGAAGRIGLLTCCGAGHER